MIINHGTNRTEIQFTSLHIFLSYSTPVVMHDLIMKKVLISEKRYSNTTSRHINKWIDLLVKERGFPSLHQAPHSYEKIAEEVLQHTWNSYVMSGGNMPVSPSEGIRVNYKNKSVIKLRIHGILDE